MATEGRAGIGAAFRLLETDSAVRRGRLIATCSIRAASFLLPLVPDGEPARGAAADAGPLPDAAGPGDGPRVQADAAPDAQPGQDVAPGQDAAPAVAGLRVDEPQEPLAGGLQARQADELLDGLRVPQADELPDGLQAPQADGPPAGEPQARQADGLPQAPDVLALPAARPDAARPDAAAMRRAPPDGGLRPDGGPRRRRVPPRHPAP
jgi:hypothetical protein